MNASDSPRGLRAIPLLAVRTLRESLADRVQGLGAEVSFYVLLSLPALGLAILASLEFFVGPEGADELTSRILDLASGVLTQEAAEDLLKPALDTLLRQSNTGLALIGLLLALWSASKVTNRTMEAVALAYDVEHRRAGWKRRLLALGITLGGIVALTVLVGLIVAGPGLLDAVSERLGISDALATVWRYLYWPVLAVGGVAMLVTFFRVATPLRIPWKRHAPGAVLTLALWLLGGLGLRIYAEVSADASIYGSLAWLVVALLWVYVSALSVLVGAELNAEIEKLWPTARETASREPKTAQTLEAIERKAEQLVASDSEPEPLAGADEESPRLNR